MAWYAFRLTAGLVVELVWRGIYSIYSIYYSRCSDDNLILCLCAGVTRGKRVNALQPTMAAAATAAAQMLFSQHSRYSVCVCLRVCTVPCHYAALMLTDITDSIRHYSLRSSQHRNTLTLCIHTKRYAGTHAKTFYRISHIVRICAGNKRTRASTSLCIYICP